MSTKTFTVNATDNFTHALVRGVWARFGDDPLTLSDIRIFLPTRRACRAVANAFLQLSGGKAMILPHLIPLGEADTDEETLIVHELASDNPDKTVLNLQPAMPPIQRNLLLTRQVMAANTEMPMAQAMPLAKDLANFIDQSVTAGLDFERLKTLVPSDYSEHWQLTLKFLEIVTDNWEVILKAHHQVDSAARRDSLLRAQAAAWYKSPPTAPVIVAGINGSIPAALELLSVIAGLDNGYIVLPGLDTAIEDESWDILGDTHPQNALKIILNHLQTDRKTVKPWVQEPVSPVKQERLKLISHLMRPAETSDKWQELSSNQTIHAKTACEQLHRIDCADESEEASVIALILRETLETPEKTAMLVTPDRKLARRVTQIMQRWNITINDSAGSDLSLWPVGSFINLSLSFLANPGDAVAFLALLKHNLCRCGHYSDQWHAKIAQFETHVLRGSRFKHGFAAYRQTLDYRAERAGKDKKVYPKQPLSDFLATVEQALSPLLSLINSRTVQPVETWLAAHVQSLENLAATGDITGAERLWRNEDGEAAAISIAQLMEQKNILNDMDFESYAALMGQLVLGQTVRPKTPAHPRVTILSPLESRLLTAETVILASLNEGHWPPESPNDPWLSRPMRTRYGLPSTDRFIGLAAHDFMSGFCANEVYLTRADRVDNAPTVKSRWLLRLETVLGRLGLDVGTLLDRRYQSLAFQMENVPEDEKTVLAEPCPCPALALRPRGLSFTDIERWIKDPYNIYAKHILHLRKLDELDGDTESADKGTLFHAIFEHFIQAIMDGSPNDKNLLTTIARDEFAASLMDSAQKATLWPIFEELADWFITEQKKRLEKGIQPVAVEQKTRWTITDALIPFSLHGRADRIDSLPGGGLEIIDYKTGTLPSETDIVLGYAPQLPLEALVARENGFGTVTADTVHQISHWGLKTKKDEDAIIKETPSTRTKEDMDAIINRIKQQLLDMIAAYYDAANPAAYRVSPDSDNRLRYNDYEHLERESEWKD